MALDSDSSTVTDSLTGTHYTVQIGHVSVSVTVATARSLRCSRAL
ncbi:MAG: hypothetical protein ABI767_10945 [Rhodanobacter sp.]